jgi:hypothetical protein
MNYPFITEKECMFCYSNFETEVRGKVLMPEAIWVYMARSVCDECVNKGRDPLQEILNHMVKVPPQ